MTTGNISSAEMVAVMMSAKSQNGIISSGTQATDSFQNLFAQSADAMGKNPSMSIETGSTDSAKTAFDKNNSNKTKEIVKASKEDATVDKESLSKLEEGIKDVIKEELGITDEELSKAMADLGLAMSDLLVPQNVSKVIAYVSDVEPAMIVTDSQLSEHLSDVVNAISELVNEISVENQIPVEDVENAFKDMIKQDTSLGQENTVKEVVKTVTVVTDAETGKEMKITMEGDKVVQTTTEGNDATIVDNKDTEGFNDTKQDNSENNQAETFAGNIINNLSESIQNSQTIQSDFSQVYNVNQADIINQLIDSIRVNVTADTSTMEIQLTPESLGKLNLTVVAKDGNITASITAQNDTVKAIIESQLIQLKEALNNQGLKVTEVEVTVAGQAFDQNLEGNNDGSQNGQTNNRRKFRGIDELVADVTETNENIVKEMMEQEGNSVNFTA